MQINQKLLTVVARAQTAEVQKQVTEEVEKAAANAGVSANAIDTASIVDEILAANKDATIYSIANEAVQKNESVKNISLKPPTTASIVREVNYWIAPQLEPSSATIGGNINFKPTGELLPSDTTVEDRYSVSVLDMSASEIANIKQIIYDLHHKKTETGDDDDDTTVGGGDDDDDTTVSGDDDDDDTTVGGGDDDDDTTVSGDDDDDTTVGGDDDDEEEPDVPKESFIEEFDDVESMFEYMSTIDPSISADKGITRAQLIALTQNDDWEDSNYDFFGSLNRVFDVLDKDDNGVLTVEEIKELIGDELGSSFSDYKSKVETFAAELQAEFDKLDAQGKLEYAIEMTREYLVAAGLTDQVKALDRLTSGTDKYNEIHVGQIALADLNTPERNPDYKTKKILGAYAYFPSQIIYNGFTVSIPVSEDDATGTYTDANGVQHNYTASTGDCGITLDLNTYANGDLFEFIDTLVHELTHATAAYNSNVWDYSFTFGVDQSMIDKMYEAGALTEDEYDYYSANLSTLITEAWDNGEYVDETNTLYSVIEFSNEKLARFYYLAATMWGEYRAYQTDADYVDSIGGDVYDKGEMSTAVDGSKEQETIEEHVNELYNHPTNNPDYVEPEPDWKWWTYA